MNNLKTGIEKENHNRLLTWNGRCFCRHISSV